jgi:hypothetical protein
LEAESRRLEFRALAKKHPLQPNSIWKLLGNLYYQSVGTKFRLLGFEVIKQRQDGLLFLVDHYCYTLVNENNKFINVVDYDLEKNFKLIDTNENEKA